MKTKEAPWYQSAAKSASLQMEAALADARYCPVLIVKHSERAFCLTMNKNTSSSAAAGNN